MEKPIDQRLEEGEAWKKLALAYRVNTDSDGGILFVSPTGFKEIIKATEAIEKLGIELPPFKADEP